MQPVAEDVLHHSAQRSSRPCGTGNPTLGSFPQHGRLCPEWGMCLEPLRNASDEMRHAVGPQHLGISFKFAKMCSEFPYISWRKKIHPVWLECQYLIYMQYAIFSGAKDLWCKWLHSDFFTVTVFTLGFCITRSGVRLPADGGASGIYAACNGLWCVFTSSDMSMLTDPKLTLYCTAPLYIHEF